MKSSELLTEIEMRGDIGRDEQRWQEPFETACVKRCSS